MPSVDTRYVLGIDPGISGGVVLIRHKGVASVEVEQFSLRDTPEKNYEMMLYICRLKPIVFIEKVSGYIGGFGQPGSSMFNFGENYGGLKALVRCLNGSWPREVRPQEWQGKLGLKRDKKKAHKTKTQWKSYLLKKAEELFPTIKFSKATADATLIAYYGCLTQEER